MAVRGTTPDYELFIEGYNLTDKTVYVTIEQGTREITKTGNDLLVEYRTVTDEETNREINISSIYFSLSQKDTLYLKEGNADVQVKWIGYDGKTWGTDEIATIKITRALLDRVIHYAGTN